MEKFIPCRKCSGKNKIGFHLYPEGFIAKKDEKGTITLVECDCHKQYEKKCILERKLTIANINKDIINYDINTNYKGSASLGEIAKIKKYIMNFINGEDKFYSAMLYFYGKNGTQKTHVAQYIGKEILANTDFNVIYITMNNLIKVLMKQDNFSNDSESEYKYNKIKNSDLLIIDEAFDKEKVTLYKSSYQIPFLDTFIRERINKKGIIFISNIHPENIEKNNFSFSIKDIICRETHINKTLLEFKDNYEQLCSNIDENGLFD